MLRTRLGRETPLDICASCRLYRGFARSTPPIRRPHDPFYLLFRCLSSNAPSCSKPPAHGKARPQAIHADGPSAFSAGTQLRHYSAWGNPEGGSWPGQSSSGWGSSVDAGRTPDPKPTPGWGGASFGGSSGISQTPRPSGGGVSQLLPHEKSALESARKVAGVSKKSRYEFEHPEQRSNIASRSFPALASDDLERGQSGEQWPGQVRRGPDPFPPPIIPNAGGHGQDQPESQLALGLGFPHLRRRQRGLDSSGNSMRSQVPSPSRRPGDDSADHSSRSPNWPSRQRPWFNANDNSFHSADDMSTVPGESNFAHARQRDFTTRGLRDSSRSFLPPRTGSYFPEDRPNDSFRTKSWGRTSATGRSSAEAPVIDNPSRPNRLRIKKDEFWSTFETKMKDYDLDAASDNTEWKSSYNRGFTAEGAPKQGEDGAYGPGHYVPAEPLGEDLSPWRKRHGFDRHREEVQDEHMHHRQKHKSSSRPRRQYDDDQWDDDQHSDEYDYETEKVKRKARARKREEKKAAKEAALAAQRPKTILLPEFITVFNLSQALGVKPDQFILDLEELGFENTLMDSIMTGETAALIAAEYGLDPSVATGESVDLKPRPPPVDPSSLPSRPPIVTIMGHVDHGKTTMLDWLRKSSVAAQEHGGITQHIGAFSVRMSTGKIMTFLDTPGHAAFLTMRQRGANVTDIVILVVAADDSVKPQTLEALKHAQNAKVPIIVAINKIDKGEGNISQVKLDLSQNGVDIEDFGGDVQVVCVSGKTGQGMDDLEENILTLSEILDIRAETDGLAEGWILEASVKPIGKVATVLVKRGTLRVGDFIVAGTTWARIRSLQNEAGVEVEEAPSGTAVEVLGWKDPPTSGDEVLQAPNETRAREATDYRRDIADWGEAAERKTGEEQKAREEAEKKILEARSRREQRGREADPLPEAPTEPGTKMINFVVKGDVVGSVEAVCVAVNEIGNNEVRPRILRASAGQIHESEVELAATAGGMIINFNNPIQGFIRRMADDKGVRILDHTVIYRLVNDVKNTLSEQLAPLVTHRILGEAEVLQIFPINIKKRIYKNIAGIRVRTGQLALNAKYKVMRRGEKVFDGKLLTFKHGKKDVIEARKGDERGIQFEDWDGVMQDDVVQAYEEVEQKRYL